MNGDSVSLLKMLNSGVRPPGLDVTTAKPAATGIEAGQFAELLNKARNGELSSNQPVTVSSDAGSSVKLSEDQLAKIAVAADKAEAAGIRKALVVLDDQQLILDVEARSITGAAKLGSGSVLSGVDGVINLSNTIGAGETSKSIVQPPAITTMNTSLSKVLLKNEDAAAA